MLGNLVTLSECPCSVQCSVKKYTESQTLDTLNSCICNNVSYLVNGDFVALVVAEIEKALYRKVHLPCEVSEACRYPAAHAMLVVKPVIQMFSNATKKVSRDV